MPVFSNPNLATIVLDSLQFLQNQQRITLYSYVIMENHLHLIASAEDLAKQMGCFKSFTARAIVDWLQENRPKSYWLKRMEAAKLRHKIGQRYQLWQEGSHPQLIGSEAMLRQKPLVQRLQGWEAHLLHGDTYRLRRKVFEAYGFKRKEDPRPPRF